jgi:hypothetical protein
MRKKFAGFAGFRRMRRMRWNSTGARSGDAARLQAAAGGQPAYNISTPLLFRLLRVADIIEDMTFMLQKEVVDRIVARRQAETYGRLGVMLAPRVTPGGCSTSDRAPSSHRRGCDNRPAGDPPAPPPGQHCPNFRRGNRRAASAADAAQRAGAAADS